MAKVGCAGILVADTFCGPMDRLPAEGELLALEGFAFKAGGCAANVAIGLAKQEIAVEISGCVGRDAYGGQLVSILERSGVGCRAIVRSEKLPTSQTVILLVKGQDRRFIHVFGANRDYVISQIERSWLKSLDVFYLGGLFVLPGVDPVELGRVLRFCRENGVVTVVDVVVPQDQNGYGGLDRILSDIDFFLPNDLEAERLTGRRDPDDQLRAFREAGANTVIITRGSRGVIALAGNERFEAGIFATPVVDPSGSGDAFAAGMITGIVERWPLDQTMVYASALGASATRAVGCTDSVFTRPQAAAFLRETPLAVTRKSIAD